MQPLDGIALYPVLFGEMESFPGVRELYMLQKEQSCNCESFTIFPIYDLALTINGNLIHGIRSAFDFGIFKRMVTAQAQP